MAKKRGLGRDLDSLLGGVSETSATSVLTETIEIKKGELQKIPVEFLHRGQFQPRQDMVEDTLKDLAESIKAQGIIQPILVRSIGENSYEIIAGERRWRAAQLAGLDEVPAIVKELSDEAAMAIALIENIQREDLNPIEKAHALKRLIDEYGLLHEELAEKIGKSRETITNMLRLLSLNIDVKHLVEKGNLEMGHARALLGLEGEKQSQAAKQVVVKELSVRQTENLVRRIKLGKTGKKFKPSLDPDVKNLQDELSDKLGAKVTIQHSASGKGKLTIQYSSLDELEGVLSHIK